jgi:hypothetical protein
MKADHLDFHRAIGYPSNKNDYLLANKGCELMVCAINGVGKVYIATSITGLPHDSAIIRDAESQAKHEDKMRQFFGVPTPECGIPYLTLRIWWWASFPAYPVALRDRGSSMLAIILLNGLSEMFIAN